MADVQQPENAVEVVESRMSGQCIRVLSVAIDRTLSRNMGARVEDVIKDTNLGESTQKILDELEFTGVVTSSLLQVGTGGTCARFYKPAVGTCIKVFAPKRK